MRIARLTLVNCIFAFVSLTATGQWNYGSAFSTTAPDASYLQVDNKQALTFMMDSLSLPYPTCNWFTQLVLPRGAWGTTNPLNYHYVGEHVSYPQPYTVGFAWSPPGSLKVSPYKMMKVGYDPYKVSHVSGPAEYSVTWPEAETVFMGTLDSGHIKPFLRSYDDFSATIRWRDTLTPSNGYMEAPVVRGAPYFSMYYHNYRPLICFPSPDLVMVDQHSVLGINDSVTIKGKRFKLLLNGDSLTFHRQIWMLYASDSIRLRFKNGKAWCVDPGFNGYLRLAYVTTRQRDPHAADSNLRIALLDQYAAYVPTGGTFHAAIGTDTSVVQMEFRFQTNHPSSDSLLMMALPHHFSMLASPPDTLLKFKCVKGEMKAVKGKTWMLTDSLPDVSWEETYGLENATPAYRDTLLQYLKMDYDSIVGRRAYSVWNGTNCPSSDMYGFGKTGAKWARLAVIADELAAWHPVCDTIAGAIRDSLKFFLNRFLDGHSSPVLLDVNKKDSIYYDKLYGGMISSLSYEHGYYEDFGNALYNDHHFHYGYFSYMAAVIARKDTAWAQTYHNKVLCLIRDIANPSSADPHFVKNRYLDWYDGNSWAKGLEGPGAGRNQESSSEASNAWYSVYLYGLATGDENLKNTGKIMLASEIRAAQHYYHISQGSTTYPASYTNTFSIVGNLWSASISNQTFFGAEARYVYGIHVIPVTPVTKYLWDDDYAYDVYYSSNLSTDPVFGTNTSTAVKNWTSICFPIQGLANIHTALEYFKTYEAFNGNFDGGASKTNTYYWLICHKHDPTLGGIGIEEENDGSQASAHLSLYPNPARDYTMVRFKMPETGPCQISLYDLQGRWMRDVFKGSGGDSEQLLYCDLRGLPAGTYLLRMNGRVSRVTVKLVVNGD